MADVPFDPPAITRKLEARGVNASHAEAITRTVRAGVTGCVAAKADLSSFAVGLRGEMGEFRRIKLIGAAVPAVLFLPWPAELILGTVPGP